MDSAKGDKLEQAGWKVGDAADLLGLTLEEQALIAQEWAAEAQRRGADVRDGRATTIPAYEALEQARTNREPASTPLRKRADRGTRAAFDAVLDKVRDADPDKGDEL